MLRSDANLSAASKGLVAGRWEFVYPDGAKEVVEWSCRRETLITDGL